MVETAFERQRNRTAGFEKSRNDVSLLGAAFRQENVLVGLANSIFDPADDEDESYNPFLEGDVTGKYRQYSSRFADVHSRQGVQDIKDKIDDELTDRQALEEGGATALLATMTAGISSPESWVPIGRGLSLLRAGKSAGVAGTAARIGADAGIGASLSEIFLQSQQETRTAGESVGNVLGAAVLGGLLGGGVGALTKAEKAAHIKLIQEAEDVGEKVYDGLIKGAHTKRFFQREADPSVFENELKNTKAFRDAMNKKADGDAEIDQNVLSRALTKVLRTPFTRMQTSQFASVRILSDRLLKNKFGKKLVNQNRGAPIESKIQVWEAEGKSQRFTLRKAFEDGQESHGLKFEDWDNELGKALRTGDNSPIPSVQTEARRLRREFLKPLEKELVEWGVIAKPLDGASYLTRVYDLERITELEQMKVMGEVEEDLADVLGRRMFDDGDFEDLDLIRAKGEEAVTNIRNEAIAARQGGASAGASRRIQLSDEELVELGVLKNNADQILDRLVTNLSPKLEFVKGFHSKGHTMLFDLRKKLAKLSDELPKSSNRGELVERMRDLSEDIHDLQSARFWDSRVKGSERANTNKIQTLLNRRAELRGISTDEAAGELAEVQKELRSFREKARTLLPAGEKDSISLNGGRASIDDLQEQFAEDLTFDVAEALSARVESSLTDLNTQFADDAINLKQARAFLQEEFNATRANSGGLSKAKQAKVQKEFENHLSDLDRVADNLQNQPFKIDDPTNITLKSTAAIRKLNFLRLGGGFALSSVPDVGNLIMQNGFETHFKAMKVIAKDFKKAFGRPEQRHWVMAELVGSSRAKNLADLNHMEANGFVNQNLQKFVDGFYADIGGKQRRIPSFATLTGLSHWNGYMSALSSLEVGHNLIQYSRKLVAGKLSKAKTQHLIDAGIDQSVARKILKEFDKHGETDSGLFLSGHESWGSGVAKNVFKTAVLSGVHDSILRVGVGELPRFMSNPMFGLLMQFKSFAFASTQSLLLSGLTRKESNLVGGLAAAAVFGGITVMAKDLARGKTLEDQTLGSFAYDSIDRSGVLSILTDPANMAEKTLGFGPHQLLGGPGASRYRSRNASDALLGPTAGFLQDGVTTIKTLMTGDVSKGSFGQARRLVPYQNLIWIRPILDKAQDSFKKTFDLEGITK